MADKLVSIIISLSLITGFGASLFYHGGNDTEYAYAFLLLSIACTCGVIGFFKKGYAIPSTVPMYFLYAFFSYVTLSLLWSNVPFVSLVTYISFAALPLSFFAISLSKDNETLPGTVFWIALLSLSALALWAIIQVTILGETYGTQAAHPMQNPNSLAALMNLGLIVSLSITLSERPTTTLKTIIFSAISLLLLGGLLATGSRGGILSFLIIIIPILTFTLPLNKRFPVKRFMAMAGIAVIAIAMQVQTSLFPGLDRIVDGIDLNDPSLISRYKIWQSAIEMLPSSGILGTGLGTFYLYYPPFRAPLLEGSAGNWVHMDPLQFGLEIGWITPLLFYGFVTSFFIHAIKTIIKFKRGSEERAILTGLVGSLFAVILHAHISFHFYVMPILIIIGIWIACWHRFSTLFTNKADQNLEITSSKNKAFFGIGFIVILLCLGALTASTMLGQIYFSKSMSAIKRGNTTDFLENIDKAEAYSPASFIAPTVQRAGFYADILKAQEVLLSEEEQRELFDNTLASLDLAESYNPAWAEIDYKRALLYKNTKREIAADKHSKEKEYLEKALKKDPLHHMSRMLLSAIYITEGRVGLAHDVLQKGLEFPRSKEQDKALRIELTKIEDLATLQKAYKIKQNHINNTK